MEQLVEIGLRNAVLAAPIALAVLLLGLVFKRPAVLHVLWLLVLVRLVMPPIWNVAVPRPPMIVADESTQKQTLTEAAVEPPVDSKLQVEDAPQLFAEENLEFAIEESWWRPVAAPPTSSETPLSPEPAVVGSQDSLAAVDVRWQWWVGAIWLSGSTLLALTAAVRLGRFAAAMRNGRDPSTFELGRVRAIAARLGLSAPPRVMVVDARVSPLLWGFWGSPVLILPAALWRRLEPSQRDALLAHELAHYCRGDHWVRGLELVASILFWWHPILWLAKRQLHEAEEQCCDAWVVWALPDSKRDYATAIVDTVGFLSEGRSELPAMASGVGHVRHLQRRLTMIMRGTTPRRMPRLAMAALLGGGLAFGGLAPTWGDDRRDGPAPTERRDERRDDRRGEERRTEERRAEERRTEERRTDDRPGDRDRAADELRAELERARADFERAAQRLRELERRFSGIREPVRPREERDPNATPRPRSDARPDPVTPPRPGNVPPPPMAPRAGGGEGPRFTPRTDRPEAGGMEQRINSIERQMQEMMRVLEQMRSEMRRGPMGPGGDRVPGPSRPGAGRNAPTDTPRPPANVDNDDVPPPPAPPLPPKSPTPPKPPRERD